MAVIHGSFDGDLPRIEGEPEDSKPTPIYTLTLDEVRQRFSQTKEYKECFEITGEEYTSNCKHFQVPTLDQVVELLDRKVAINIEVKTPRDDALKPNYNIDRLIRVMHEKLQNNFNSNHPEHIREYCFVSSFDFIFIERFRKLQSSLEPNKQIKFMYLHTRKPEDVLPESDVTQHWDLGANI